MCNIFIDDPGIQFTCHVQCASGLDLECDVVNDAKCQTKFKDVQHALCTHSQVSTVFSFQEVQYRVLVDQIYSKCRMKVWSTFVIHLQSNLMARLCWGRWFLSFWDWSWSRSVSVDVYCSVALGFFLVDSRLSRCWILKSRLFFAWLRAVHITSRAFTLTYVTRHSNVNEGLFFLQINNSR